MSRRKVEQFSNTNEINPKNWASVLEDALIPDKKEIFLKRKRAIDLYFDEESLDVIKNETGVVRSELYRFLERCFTLDPNGQEWGYRALIPRKRVENEEESGPFQLFLAKYPTIKDHIDEWFLNRKRKNLQPIKGLKEIHADFVRLCRESNIPSSEYPMNTKTVSRQSLYRYLKSLEAMNFYQASKRYGDEGARKIKSDPSKRNTATPQIYRPYQRVQFDGHRIDAMFTIHFTTPIGDQITEILERLWLLAIIDEPTRAILGYHISYGAEYSSYDVLKCIENAIIPWKPIQFSISGISYPKGAGFPSGLIEQAKWAVWDEFLVDNGQANLATIVKKTITEKVGAHMNPGPVEMPERRGIIERFFKKLEENGFHRFPNTTGSNPDDPRRRDPEKNARRFDITVKDLEEITEVIIADYNNTPHHALYGLTPLEAMRQRMEKGLPVRYLKEEYRDEYTFVSLKITRKVNGSIKHGRRPYINYEGAEYTNEILARMFDLAGEQLHLVVNINDLRYVKAFFEDGSEFGILTASGKWGLTPHTLQMRKQINKLKNDRILEFGYNDDPVQIYLNYLSEKATTNKKDRNKLAAAQKHQKDFEDKPLQNPTEPEPPTPKPDHNIVKAQQPKKVEKKSGEPIDRKEPPSKLRKTILY
ncbi:hypothetical protein ACPV3A_28200 [Paenibacillus sp. Dod16]|uniref:hypothetical protein n=1 Tax=Paenibacillus sp. Dod16 TaxID=3416392 RepID=UPI003CF1ABBE